MLLLLLGGNVHDFRSAQLMINQLEQSDIDERSRHLAATLDDSIRTAEYLIARAALRELDSDGYMTFLTRRAPILTQYDPACEAVMYLDKEGRLLYLNTATEDTALGCSAYELVGALVAHGHVQGPENLLIDLAGARHLAVMHPIAYSDGSVLIGLFNIQVILHELVAHLSLPEEGDTTRSLTLQFHDGTAVRYSAGAAQFINVPPGAMPHAAALRASPHKWLLEAPPENAAAYARMHRENAQRLVVNLGLSLVASLFLLFFILVVHRLRKSRAQLASAEERLRLAVTGADMSVWEWWPHEGKINFSDAWPFDGGRGVTPDFEAWKNSLHPEDRAAVLAQLELHLQGVLPLFRAEFRFLAHCGEYRWGLSMGRVSTGSESKTARRMVGVYLDVTERKQAEEARERLAAIVKGSGDAIISLDNEGRVTSWNESAGRMLGLRQLETIGKPLWMCCGAGHVKEFAIVMWRVRQGDTVRDHEIDQVDAEGNHRCISMTFSPILNSLGQFEAFAVVARDVTVSRQTERALRESREDLNKAQSVARLGSWRTDLATQYVSWSPQMFTLLDIDPATFDGDHLAAVFNRVHPEDLELVITSSRAVLEDQQVLAIVFRILLPSGELRYISGETEALRDDSGTVIAMFGTLQDITKLKEVENALRENQQRYALAVRAGQTGVWDFELTTGKFSPDDTFREIYDYPANAPGAFDLQTWLSRLPEEDRERCLEIAITHFNEQSTHFEVEHRIFRGDGALRWVYAMGQVMRDETGRPQRLLGTLTDVTERKRALLELRESEERLEFAMRGADLGMWDWNPQSDEIQYDRGWVELLGFSKEESRNDTAFYLKLIHPQDLPRVVDAMQAHMQGHAPHYEAEFRMRTRDGRWLWLANRGRVIARDAGGAPVRISGVIRDITDQKTAEAALRRETIRAQHYLDIAGVMMLALDQRGAVSLINSKGCQILGYEEHEITGKDWIDTCVPPRFHSAMRNLFKKIMRGDITEFESFISPVITRDAEERTIAWHNTLLLNDAGINEGILSSGEDITSRLRAEQEARLREQQLIQADKMASLGVLVSGVAHEINNPNAFIVSNASIFAAVWKDAIPVLDAYQRENGDFLLGGVPYSMIRERAPRLIQGMLDGADRIRVTVQELRRFAQQEPDGLIELVSLNEVLESAITLLHNMIRKSTRNFTFTPSSSLPAIHGSFRRLEQVAINLIQNACQALSSPEQSIHVRTQLDEEHGMALLIVEDQGTGIAEEDLPRITDPFFTTKRAEDGTGLGLSICATIVGEHQGRLEFTSRPGDGTKALVALPTENTLAERGAKKHGFSLQ
jgi:PAS domain S-box-containing protein